LGGGGDDDLDSVGYARVREAGEVLGRDGEAARVGERLFDRAPDPDLAFALACAWARAGNAARSADFAARAVALGFRAWERAEAALTGEGGSRAREGMAAARARED
jgi:hypothetical protein